MELKAPMGGTVWKVTKQEGDAVNIGEAVVILESMKMEIPVESTKDGVLSKLHVNEGDFVQENDLVAEVE